MAKCVSCKKIFNVKKRFSTVFKSKPRRFFPRSVPGRYALAKKFYVNYNARRNKPTFWRKK